MILSSSNISKTELSFKTTKFKYLSIAFIVLYKKCIEYKKCSALQLTFFKKNIIYVKFSIIYKQYAVIDCEMYSKATFQIAAKKHDLFIPKIIHIFKYIIFSFFSEYHIVFAILKIYFYAFM